MAVLSVVSYLPVNPSPSNSTPSVMKTSHDMAKELLELPDKPMLVPGRAGDEGMDLRVAGLGIHHYFDAYILVPMTRDCYPSEANTPLLK